MSKFNKRDLIKNIAIVFLVIILILTFFSNTIMNKSLPEVSTQSISNGTISTQLRGEGTVEAEDPYNLILDETRKISSVMVHEGDEVQKGDVIYKLEGVQGQELTDAKNEYEKALSEYDLYILGSGLTKAEIEQVQNGVTLTTNTILTALEAKDAEITAAQKVVDDLENRVADITKQINSLQYSSPDTSAETAAVNKAKQELETAKAQLTLYDDYRAALQEVNDLTNELNYWNGLTITPDIQSKIDTLTDKLNIANYALTQALSKLPNGTYTDEAYNAAIAEVNAKQSALDTANRNLSNKSNSTDATSNSLELQKIQLESELKNAKAKVERLSAERKDYYDKECKKIELESKYQGLLQKEAVIKDLEKKSVGGEITSPVDGTVMKVSYQAGQTVNAGDTVCKIMLSGKGYKLSFPVTGKQASSVKVGDEVTVVNGWYYYDINVNLVSILPDKESTRDGKRLVFSLSGESVTEGMSLTLSVGKRSSNYDMIVPLTALKEDNNGNFILIVKSKSTPFGSRYIATRVDVDVLAKDDMNAAISTGLEGYEFVITSSSKPIKNGDQVKIAE